MSFEEHRGPIAGCGGFPDIHAGGNSGRFPQRTPIKNLYLAGAWTAPGHGYGAVIPSGLMCFAEIMKSW